MPLIAQIEYGYEAAERAKPGSGKEFVVAFAQLVAARNAAALSDPALKEILNLPAPDIQLQFARGPPPGKPTMPLELRQQVITLSDYCAASPLGSIHSVFVNHLGLEGSRAYDILSSSSNQQEAFVAAFESLPDPEICRAKVDELARAIHKRNFAIGLEPVFAAIFKKGGPGSDDGGWGATPRGTDGGPGGGGGGAGEGIRPTGGGSGGGSFPTVSDPITRQASIERYSEFVHRNYDSGNGRAEAGGGVTTGGGGGGIGGGGGGGSHINRSFRSMSRSAKGFGGIVFGNKVSSASGTPHPTSVQYQRGASIVGKLIVHFADGHPAQLEGVTLENVLAAYEMVYDPPPGIDPVVSDQGTGMVGIDENTAGLASQSSDFAVAAMFKVLLHPSLVNKALGWAFVRVDAMPIERGLLRKSIPAAADAPVTAAVEQLWDTLSHPDSIGTWKIVDVPIQISILTNLQPAMVVPLRAVDESLNYPIGLRKSAFVEMNHFLLDKQDAAIPDAMKTEVDATLADSFYRLLPGLVQISPDYAEVNNFARILAVVRWAKESGASFDTSSLPGVPAPVNTPPVISVSRFGILPASHWNKTLQSLLALLVSLHLFLLFPLIFYCLSLRKALLRCSPQTRQVNPVRVWILMAPLVNLLWFPILVIKLAHSLGSEFQHRSIRAARRPGRAVGLAAGAFFVGALTTSYSLEFSFAAFVCWLIHWVRVALASRKLRPTVSKPPPLTSTTIPNPQLSTT